jgi:hypothetical protein
MRAWFVAAWIVVSPATSLAQTPNPVCDPACDVGLHCNAAEVCEPDEPVPSEPIAPPATRTPRDEPAPASPPPAPAPAPVPEPQPEPAPAEPSPTALIPAPDEEYPDAPLPPELAPRSTARRHDAFMLRLTLGIGASALRATQSDIDADLKYDGFGASFSLDAGGAPLENLIVHGRLGSFMLTQPDLSIDGEDRGSFEDVSLFTFLIAPAVTYYVMPLNLYGTLAIGVSWVVYADASRESDNATDPGIGFNAELGKEWWVMRDWGFGLAGRFWLTRLTDAAAGHRTATSWSGFALLFSATYQ